MGQGIWIIFLSESIIFTVWKTKLIVGTVKCLKLFSAGRAKERQNVIVVKALVV